MTDAADPTTGGASTGDSGKVVLNVWTAVVVLILMGTLIAVLALVLGEYGSAQDSATILGIIVPGFVSVGTAAFGIAVAYNATTGKAAAEAGKAAASERQQIAEETKDKTSAAASSAISTAIDHVDGVEAALERIVEPIKEGLPSPAGETDYLIAPEMTTGPRLTIGSDDIEDAESRIAAARASLEGFLQQQRS